MKHHLGQNVYLTLENDAIIFGTITSIYVLKAGEPKYLISGYPFFVSEDEVGIACSSIIPTPVKMILPPGC
jgi:hypothetical protein